MFRRNGMRESIRSNIRGSHQHVWLLWLLVHSSFYPSVSFSEILFISVLIKICSKINNDEIRKKIRLFVTNYYIKKQIKTSQENDAHIRNRHIFFLQI
jgi:hypothetical protein